MRWSEMVKKRTLIISASHPTLHGVSARNSAFSIGAIRHPSILVAGPILLTTDMVQIHQLQVPVCKTSPFLSLFLPAVNAYLAALLLGNIPLNGKFCNVPYYG